MPYIFTNGELQHLRECPVCGRAIDHTEYEEMFGEMLYYHYDDGEDFCAVQVTDNPTTPQMELK